MKTPTPLHTGWPAVFVLMLLAAGCASSKGPNGGVVPGEPTGPAADADLPSARSALALEEAMSELGVAKNDPRVLLLTNAGFARGDGRGTEFFADVATEVSGCTIGKRSLYFLHSPETEALWFAVFRRDDRRLSFRKRVDGAFEGQVLVADPGLLEQPDAWKQANAGPIRGRLFPIISFSDAWARGADPLLLRCAAFHNHCCGGVTAGYLSGRYIQEHLPLRAGEEYLFVTASPSCAMDALQVMFDATAGKKGMFSTKADPDELTEYAIDGVRPLTLVMRVNETADTCDGMLIGFAWERTNQTSKLWNAAEVAELDCVKVLKRFSGPATLARASSLTGLHPYEVVWQE